jgi:drug/metabolite transporter (DMT)-like permease
VLWSTSGLFIKIIDWKPLSILSGRSIISFFVFLIYLRRPRMKWSRLQISGAFGYVGVQLFFVISTKLTAAANAIFLQYTGSLYLFLFGYWFLGEPPHRTDWISTPIIFLGLILFLGDGLRFSGIEGNLFGALSGLSMAIMMLCMRREKADEPGTLILLGCLIGILIGFPSLIQETFSLNSVGIILFLGVFQMGLSYVFFSIAIRYLDALESSLILFIEPVLNPVWVFLIIGEVPGCLALLGGLLVIGTAVARAVVSARAGSVE